MNLAIKNINKVKDASIKLNGLTVIAGENDSGKSTIGKILFSTIKALSNTDERVASKKEDRLNKYISSFYRRSNLSSKVLLSEKATFPFSTRRLNKELLALSDDATINSFFKQKENEIEELQVTPRIKSLMLQDLKNILICITEKDNRAADIATEIQYLIESEFMNKICSINTSESMVELSMDDNEKNKLFFDIIDDKVKTVNISGGTFLQDATYIESPLYIHLLDSLLYSSSFRETSMRMFRPMVPSHIKDMMDKLNSIKYIRKGEQLIEDNLRDLSSITGGHFYFDAKKRTLLFEKDGISLFPINVASGIKSFGVIQMLLEIDAINPNKILIWDEPENHLHPQWQIEFANILVQLTKAGIPIVISTHSPYFVQGIRYFAAKQSVTEFVNYYLNETDNGLSVFNDVSNDLNSIFLKLSKPLNDIMNID